jgi:hypothetical protein
LPRKYKALKSNSSTIKKRINVISIKNIQNIVQRKNRLPFEMMVIFYIIVRRMITMPGIINMKYLKYLISIKEVRKEGIE